MAAKTLTPQDRTARREAARALHASLDDSAALINGVYATALRLVMDAFEGNVHREVDGFSAHRDWLVSTFDFTFSAAGNIASIAKLASKFDRLAEAALNGYARIDQVAYAVNQLHKTPAAALFARTPFRTPVASPFDAAVSCATPEALVVEFAAHAPYRELRRHLTELHAGLAEEVELLDGLGEKSLQYLEVQQIEEGGMWALSGLLSSDTGRLLDKYLKTACPPPRDDETDQYGVLPPQANRNAEALHQLIAGYGSSSQAATRHGHTATLDLVVDIETLQGKDTGRLPILEGEPISVAQARLLACEALVIPSVFDYARGEAVELGRALRLPNTALRRKLELEQQGGCAWHGCDRPVSWCEAHHLAHWADGGDTNAENLILLCRFHHGRLHTEGWTVEKTDPGQAVITHHDHPIGIAGRECGCSDWRTDADLDEAFQHDEANVFPTGLFASEWSEAMKPGLQVKLEQVEQGREYFEDPIWQGRRKRANATEIPVIELGAMAPPPPIYGERNSAEELIPF
ncbi:HNH endonuclease signature motif containing protein [Glycomyces paridis]|uniref:DUF222 domain-containing protein n=1 Tax=Glycomyces paridis TaxID=2126555 RepID=A0A4S8PBB9_9ACTN|nr:HNH endonuclease signature motif containing protein [Glycomyces paridis]THV27580.1 DUF222 domain-containing protein [Glycomyces paridis]